MRRVRGFTIVELMVVVAIVAILSAIAIPLLYTAQLKAKRSELDLICDGIKVAEMAYFANSAMYLVQDDWGTDEDVWYPVFWSMGTPNPDKVCHDLITEGGVESWWDPNFTELEIFRLLGYAPDGCLRGAYNISRVVWPECAMTTQMGCVDQGGTCFYVEGWADLDNNGQNVCGYAGVSDGVVKEFEIQPVAAARY